MVKIKQTVIILMILISFVRVNAQNTTRYCIDNQTLREFTHFVINNKETTISENITCDFGCDDTNNSCRADPFFIDLFILLGFIILFVFIVYLYRRWSK